ncbi:MAG: hypothetical protein K9L65_16560, partial [Chromatiaceae bacterium]|nr:hypothetical protein [Chromatiaceae bacterium]
LPEPIIALGQGGLHGRTRNLAVRMTLTAPADALPESAGNPSTAIEQLQQHTRTHNAETRNAEQQGLEHGIGSGSQAKLDWTALAINDWRLSAEIDNLTIDTQAQRASSPRALRQLSPGNVSSTASSTASSHASSHASSTASSNTSRTTSSNADQGRSPAIPPATPPTTSTAAAIPSLSGLDLSIDLGPRGGYASVSGSNVGLDLQPLFAEPHRFTRLEGRFAWRLMPAGSIHLWTEALSAETQDLETLTRLSLCLHPSGINPFIDLHTHLRNGRISALPRWLPVGIMDDRLEDWLLQAVVAGRVESGDLLLRGPLERFPFDDQEGRFILELRAVDGVLDYGVDAQAAEPSTTTGLSNAEQTQTLSWPPLQQVAATLRFENRSLEIDVPSAEILNSQVDAGRVSLPDLWQPTYLEIDAQGEGPLADGMHVLATSPLAQQLGGLASTVTVSGDGGIRLRLGVPLNQALPFRYAGEFLWEPPSEIGAEEGADQNTNRSADLSPDTLASNRDDANQDRTLSINGTDIKFDQITGRLRFDETGIEADGIQTQLGKQALDVDVKTLDSGSADGRTLIDLRGQTAVDRLSETLPSPLWSLVSGTLDWRLGLTLNNRDAAEQKPPIHFALSSDLRSVSLAVPSPVGKPTREPRNLQLSGRFQDQWPLSVSLEYGAIGGLLEIDRRPNGAIELPRLAIDLNGQPTALPPESAIQIRGALERLALEPWINWFGKADLKALRGGGQRNGAEAGFRLLPVQLRIADLNLGDLQLNDVEAVLTSEPAGGWDIRFSAQQTGDAQIRLPATTADSEQPRRIRLERLDIEPLLAAHDGPTPEPNPEPKPLSRADPREFGRLDLRIEQLHYGEDLLGQLRIRSQPVPNGVRFETLTLAGPHVDATGSGDWQIDATDYIESSLQVSAKSNAVGELLRESGFYSALSGAPGTLQLALSWPGGPNELSLARARGSMKIEVGSGRMLEMEPGVGRMLGILNTGALSRRLSLDFSDVFNDGLSFDSMTGEIAIGSGDATIRNLNILAPPADIRITGRTNLVDGLLDQQVEVTPKIGVGLALASAVAGGPVVGAAVYLADKVTEGAVERLGRYAYQVSGPWRDPVIRRIDTVGSPSVGNLFVDDPPAGGSAVTDAAPSSSTGTQAKPKDPAPAGAEDTSSPFLEGF